jgi:tetratricopeptide (TPR) repeat protein
MKLFPTVATAALIAAGTAAPPALAQRPQAASPAPAVPAPTPRKYNVAKAAQKPLQALQAAVTKKDEAAYPAALAAAEAVATNTDEKYLVAKFRLQHAIDHNDPAAELEGLQAVLATGGADPAETLLFNRHIGTLSANAKDWPRAETALTAALAGNPNDLDSTVNLARTKIELHKDAEALTLLLKAIQLSDAAGQQAPEPWYRNALGLAYRTKNQAAIDAMNAALLRLYPNGQNLGNAILIYNNGTELPKDIQLDLFRLLYASGGMTTSGEYMQLATMLETGGLPGEEKAVLESGIRAGKVSGASAQQMLARSSGRVAEDRAALPAAETRARAAATGTLALSTAAAYAGYGDYAKAADLYRVALQKGGVDANVVNTRLGIALALGGRRAEAEAAFHAVTGARAKLAELWLTWLGQRG